MAVVKYYPFSELRSIQERMNRILGLIGGTEGGEELQEGVWQPPVDIYEDAETVVIVVDLPEVEQKDIELKIEDNTLIMRGERKPARNVGPEKYHRIERYYGTFQRSFALPHTIDQASVKAACDKGVLTIIMPKRVETKPKQIQVEMR